MCALLRTFFQNARKPDGIAGRIMLWAMNWGHASLAEWGRSHVSPAPDARVLDIGCPRARHRMRRRGKSGAVSEAMPTGAGVRD